MSEIPTLRLRNLTSVEQSIFVDNRRIVLEPGAEKDFERAVAEQFLALCDGLVEIVEEVVDIGSVKGEDPDMGIMWLANMTGDPDAPKTIKRKKRTGRGEFEYVDVPNPKAEAIDIEREMDMGQVEYETQDGPLADNMPKKLVTLPKYSRKAFPKEVGKWMLDRDAAAGWISAYHRGRVIESRPKSGFEPDRSWRLDDMRCYLRMLDREVDIGPSEEAVLEKAVASNEDPDAALLSARNLCLKRLHFRLAKREVRAISKVEFDAYKPEFLKQDAKRTPPAAPSASTGANAQL